MTQLHRGVLAYHVIFCPYGFWLPNAPRGSWSDFVGAWELFLAAGRATRTSTRQSVAHAPHDNQARQDAKLALNYPPVLFTGEQARSVGVGFRRMIETARYTVHACSILPDHVHMVIGRHHYRIEQVVRLLKSRAVEELNAMRLHPLASFADPDGRLPPPWARGCWKVFLNNAADILRSIQYVQNNPIKEGKPAQSWSFVSPYVVDTSPV
jgi:REP element-mobilizing transposase RayT